MLLPAQKTPPTTPAGPPMPDKRVMALRRFALSITAFSIVGRFLLGFEQSWTQWAVSLAASYTFELLFDTVHAWAAGRRPAFLGGGMPRLVTFLLPAHIAGTALAMLLYPGDRLLPFVFAAAVAAGSKYLFRAPVAGRWRHVFNPSNLSIAVMLTFYTWVGPAPPYHFTENVSGLLDWVIPLILLTSGLMLNIKLTDKWPLILAWSLGFVAQAIVRDLLSGDRAPAILSVAVGTAFVLFTNYMITDPGTTPTRHRHQVVFGLTAATLYGALAAAGITFGLFYCLVLTCFLRGLILWAVHLRGLASARQPRTASPALDTMTPASPSRHPATAATLRVAEEQAGA